MDAEKVALSLSTSLKRVLEPSAPLPLKLLAARGLTPGAKPAEAVTVVALLAQGEDDNVASTARETLGQLPTPLLHGAVTSDLPEDVLMILATKNAGHVEFVAKALALPALSEEVAVVLATNASELSAERIAVNEELLLRCPRAIERLYMNANTRMSTANRCLELAVRHGLRLDGIPAFAEAAAAISGELIPELGEEPTYDDELSKKAADLAEAAEQSLDTHTLDPETGEEVLRSSFTPLHAALTAMTVSQKVRRALVGSSTERMILVRDKSRLVATAAVRSPKLTELEVVRITASRNVSDEVLRVLASDRDWVRSHQVKLNLVTNPRTPFALAVRLIPHLRDHELRALTRNKNVPGAVANAARQQVSRKK